MAFYKVMKNNGEIVKITFEEVKRLLPVWGKKTVREYENEVYRLDDVYNDFYLVAGKAEALRYSASIISFNNQK